MKFTVHKLRVGDVVRAHIVEMVSESDYIVSFQGDLIRVKNESLKSLNVNDKVLVKVASTNPLSFQLLPQDALTRGATRINISI